MHAAARSAMTSIGVRRGALIGVTAVLVCSLALMPDEDEVAMGLLVVEVLVDVLVVEEQTLLEMQPGSRDGVFASSHD
ncbi:unnamed protein product [Phytophthora fragariaefolia]|uniref:Unnamed protein product n=1 Tax=Phytophthora fragariaefolia TaxID=1490495 RepID=A0A9W7D0Q4_9STRA|nr:unnamed protein product [Phytophthora fragariaefolia]